MESSDTKVQLRDVDDTFVVLFHGEEKFKWLECLHNHYSDKFRKSVTHFTIKKFNILLQKTKKQIKSIFRKMLYRECLRIRGEGNGQQVKSCLIKDGKEKSQIISNIPNI